MRTLPTGAALALFFCGSAVAAELSVSTPPYAPRPAAVSPLYDWTGCFIGPNLGGGWSGTTFKDATTLATLGTNNAAAGLFGGAQVGCDYQFGWATFGLQGMFDGTPATSQNIWPVPVAVNTTRVRWLSTLTFRLGIAPTPALLWYLRAGGAWVRDAHTVETPAGQPLFTADPTRSGWTVGVGFEWGFAPNWSLFAEYSYADFATKTVSFTPVSTQSLALGTGVPGLPFPPLAAGGVFPINIRQNANLLLAGVNFRFHPSWPW